MGVAVPPQTDWRIWRISYVAGQMGLIRSGFEMVSWNTQPNGKGNSFEVGEVMTLTNSTTLLRNGKVISQLPYLGAVGSFGKNSTLLSPALKSQVERLALTVRMKKYSSVKITATPRQLDLRR